MAVVQTVTYKNSNATYEGVEDSVNALRATASEAYLEHLSDWRDKHVVEADFDVDSQTLTLVRTWSNNEDYESYKIGVPDRDGLYAIFDAAGWSINIEEQYT